MLPSTSFAAESYLAAIVRSSDDAILSRSLDGRITSWNQAAEQLFGFTEAEAVGDDISIIVPEAQRAEATEMLERVRAGEIVRHVETVRRRKDGTLVDVSITASPIRNASGDVVGVSGIIRDIGEWRRTDFAARRLAAIVQSSDDAIVSKDLNGIVMSWNPAAERMFGYAAEEMIGHSILKIIPADRRAEEDEVLARVRAGLGVDHFETIRQRKDGSLVEISLTVSPVRNPAGVIVGASKIARDVTLKKRVEELRRRAAEEREHARRQELEAENRRAHEASRLKSEFVANMSHELRTPLNAIMGFAELMRSGRVGDVSARHREYLDDILGSARHLLRLIEDVLDLARVESGRIDFRPETVSVQAVVAETCDIVRGFAGERRVEVVLEADQTIGEATLDPAKLKQVLYNFLSNAIKFSHDGGRVIVRVRDEGAADFRIDVEDAGIGIDEADLPRLFVEFQQLDTGTAKRYPGTGLGLALTRRIVEAQGGTVAVRSTRGKGSTFSVTLPKNVPATSATATFRRLRESA